MNLIATIVATLALLFGGAPAAAHDGEGRAAASAEAAGAAAASCVTIKRRQGRKYVTRIKRVSGVVDRMVNLRLRDRAFPGEETWTVQSGGSRLIVRCRVVDGVVRLATKGGARVRVAPPSVPSPTPPPPLVATWDGPLTLHTTVGQEWGIPAAVAAWNAGLPVDRRVTLVDSLCASQDRYCMEVSAVPQIDSGGVAWGLADSYPINGQMMACDVVLSEQAPAEYRASIFAHELGHCLGLSHWDFAGSVMHEIASTMSGPSREDVAWLRAAYDSGSR